jgi:hypothetical protein
MEPLLMLNVVQRALVIICAPLLALFGLALWCARKICALAAGLFGWELAWPPVLVDDMKVASSSHAQSRMRARRIVKPRRSSRP